MRALTVRQPYAWAIMHGGKTVENRSRNIAGSYRGPVAITAALTLDRDYDRTLIAKSVGSLARALTRSNAIAQRFGNLGGILGVVDLVDVHLNRSSHGESHFGKPVCFDQSTPTGELCSEWAQFMPVGGYHLVLANPRPLLKPIPARGRLGLWTLPDDIAAQVEEALR